MENKVKRIRYVDFENQKKSTYEKYVDEIDYLITSGITLSCNAISDQKFPLKETINKNLIKLYYNDVGLLSNMLFTTNIFAIIKEENNINLGSLYETVVATELIAHNHQLYYFDSKKVGEVDFFNQ